MVKNGSQAERSPGANGGKAPAERGAQRQPAVGKGHGPMEEVRQQKGWGTGCDLGVGGSWTGGSGSERGGKRGLGRRAGALLPWVRRYRGTQVDVGNVGSLGKEVHREWDGVAQEPGSLGVWFKKKKKKKVGGVT